MTKKSRTKNKFFLHNGTKFIVLISCFLLLEFVCFNLVKAEWQEPTAAPPQGNVDPLLHIGAASQTKAGKLTVGGLESTAGIKVTGNVDLPANSITDSLVVDTLTASNYLPLTGGTVTGKTTFGDEMTLNSNLTVNGNVTAQTLTLTSENIIFTGNVRANKRFDVGTNLTVGGDLTVAGKLAVGNNTVLSDSEFKLPAGVITEEMLAFNVLKGSYLPLSGGTVTGNILLNGNLLSSGTAAFQNDVAIGGTLNVGILRADAVTKFILSDDLQVGEKVRLRHIDSNDYSQTYPGIIEADNLISDSSAINADVASFKNYSSTHSALYAEATNGYAGYFSGATKVIGSLIVSGPFTLTGLATVSNLVSNDSISGRTLTLAADATFNGGLYSNGYVQLNGLTFDINSGTNFNGLVNFNQDVSFKGSLTAINSAATFGSTISVANSAVFNDTVRLAGSDLVANSNNTDCQLQAEGVKICPNGMFMCGYSDDYEPIRIYCSEL